LQNGRVPTCAPTLEKSIIRPAAKRAPIFAEPDQLSLIETRQTIAFISVTVLKMLDQPKDFRTDRRAAAIADDARIEQSFGRPEAFANADT
jgi:hypothetical protein